MMAAGAVSGMIAVAAGAFGAHAMKGRVSPELVETFQTGAHYQMYHALALLALGLALGRGTGPVAVWAGWLFIVGSIVFSGSLYALALTGARWWGAVTPIGGVCLILGWVVFAWGIVTAESLNLG